MADEGIRVKLDSLADHDLLVENGIVLRELAERQQACNLACQKRLDMFETRIGEFNKLEGWMKGLWLIMGGIVVAAIAAWWRTRG